MYNLLIVDDEKSVVESMANDIPWEDLDVSDVSVAYSGRQALDIIEGKRIDILLSDINMPDLDGIHLSEQIHLRFQHTKIIFLTGYDRFDYAMQAIQHGVFAYLLKPVTNKELLDTVQHALEALQEEIEKTAAYSRVEQQYIDALPLLQNRFFIEWIVEGRFNTTDAVASQLHELHMDLSVDSPYILMLLKVDELRADDVLDDRQQIALQNMVSDTLLQNHKSMIFKITQNTYGIILPVSSEHDGLDIIRRTKDMWSIFLKFVQYTIRYPVSLFVMDQTASVLTLNGCYKALRSQMNRYLPLRSGMLNVLRPSELADIYDAIAALNDYPG